MPVLSTDAYGHRVPTNNGLGANLAAGAVSTSAAGTLAPTTAAGQTPTVTSVNANDTAGSFVLNPVTGGGAQAAGAVVQVTFAEPYAVTPKGVVVDMCDNAGGASAVAISAAAQTVTTTGFTINVASALTTAHNYFTSYIVLP